MIPGSSGGDSRGRSGAPGYSLVELLIVAAIILVLAGILLVVVRKIVQLIHSLFGPGFMLW